MVLIDRASLEGYLEIRVGSVGTSIVGGMCYPEAHSSYQGGRGGMTIQDNRVQQPDPVFPQFCDCLETNATLIQCLTCVWRSVTH